MASYQEINDILNLEDTTPEEQAEKNRDLQERKRLRESGKLKQIADKIRAKPSVK